jgi:hypothetical protein
MNKKHQPIKENKPKKRCKIDEPVINSILRGIKENSTRNKGVSK